MKITNEKYNNIIAMMCAEEADKIVALTIIEQMNFKENATKILLLKKHSTSSNALWQEHAPSIYEKLESLAKNKVLDVTRHLTYKSILQAMTLMKVPPAEFDFYMKDFSDYLCEQVKGLGYDFIDSIDINIKYKDYEQDRQPSESV
jgi:hypothetical protein